MQILMRSLVKDGDNPRFSWFEVSDHKWEIMKPIVETFLTDHEVNRDGRTLDAIFETWKKIMARADTVKKKVDEAALKGIQGLPCDKDGKEVWYKLVKTEAEQTWDSAGTAEVQNWSEKMTRIITMIQGSLQLVKGKIYRS